jgi:hypothetical protein
MAVIRHIFEHLVPLVFGVILAFLISHFKAEIFDHFEWWLPGFIILFLLYSYALEGIKRLAFFRFSKEYRFCGLYAELYVREAGTVFVAPFLLLHDIRDDVLRVFGRAIPVNHGGLVPASGNPSWKSTTVALSAPSSSTRELAMLFEGQKDGRSDIHGTTRVGIPIGASGDKSARRGYFLDTDIKEPAFRPAENRPFETIKDLADAVDAVRFFSIKFEPTQFRDFVASCDKMGQRWLLRFRLFCEPSEATFRRFLGKTGVKFLADEAPPDGLYQNISAILKAAAAALSTPPPGAATNPASGGASNQIDRTG